MTKDQVAQEAAEYIAANLEPRPDPSIGISVIYPGGKPPTEVEAIKAALLTGFIWTSWLDERVTSAMRQIHGAPSA